MDHSRALTIEGWMQPEDLIWLAAQAKICNRIVELGAWKGRSTRALGDNVLGEVWTVDTWQGTPSELDTYHAEVKRIGSDGLYAIFERNMKDLLGTKVHPLKMDGTDAFKWLLNKFGPRSFDLAFIDADHSHESVCKDISNYRQLVRPGGIICGHDQYYIKRALKATIGDYETVKDIWFKVLE